MRAVVILIIGFWSGVSGAEILLCTGGDIPGGAKLAGYQGCTTVSHYQEGVDRGATVNGSGAQQGNPEFADISLTRTFDISSNALRAAAINGTPRDWSLRFVSTGCGSQALEYQRIDLTNAAVTAYSAGATDTTLPTETISLSFTAVRYIQTVYDQACQVADTFSFGWDRVGLSVIP
ncbi:MAG: type VI secretion system tube protein Hcp [Pseudomonadota bacterium]